MDTLTSTYNSKECPGVCVHTFATIICYDVLDDIPCPAPNMKCCIENNPDNTTISATGSGGSSQASATKVVTTTTERPTTTTTTTERPTTKEPKIHSKPSKDKKDGRKALDYTNVNFLIKNFSFLN